MNFPGECVRHLLHRALRTSGALAVLGLLVVSALTAQGTGPDAAEVYRRFAPRVVKIQSVEQSSGAKAAIGSGFFVSAEGHVVTNYHVISELVNLPDQYRVELIDGGDTTRAVEVLANEFVLRFRRPPHELTLFTDGRAIVKGTDDPALARSLVARYFGT